MFRGRQWGGFKWTEPIDCLTVKYDLTREKSKVAVWDVVRGLYQKGLSICYNGLPWSDFCLYSPFAYSLSYCAFPWSVLFYLLTLLLSSAKRYLSFEKHQFSAVSWTKNGLKQCNGKRFFCHGSSRIWLNFSMLSNLVISKQGAKFFGTKEDESFYWNLLRKGSHLLKVHRRIARHHPSIKCFRSSISTKFL